MAERPLTAFIQERERQVEKEGWTHAHDDEHRDGELLRAAVIYYTNATNPEGILPMRQDGAPSGWPWDAHWWKPKNPERDLIRAGALCLAEWERLQRTGRSANHVLQKLDLISDALDRARGESGDGQ